MQKRVDFASINTKNVKIKEGEINTTYSFECSLSDGEEKKNFQRPCSEKGFFQHTHQSKKNF
jgi:hypothetical protein